MWSLFGRMWRPNFFLDRTGSGSEPVAQGQLLAGYAFSEEGTPPFVANRVSRAEEADTGGPDAGF